jgi:polysaccharide export outer membrane protein
MMGLASSRKKAIALYGKHIAMFIVGVATLVSAGCAGGNSFVWVNDEPDAIVLATTTDKVSSGDVISIRVFGQDNLTAKAPVREDGKLSVPLIGPVQVLDRLPEDISKEVATRLEPFVNGPRVMTVIEERHIKVIVAGEVQRPGSQELAGPTDVLTAIANAGGLSQFASESNIYVLRRTPTGAHRIRFRWSELSRGEGKASKFRLRDMDQVVVE